MRAQINSQKHIVQQSTFSVSLGSKVAVLIAEGVATADVNQNFEVEEGSTIKAVYLEFWITGDDAVQSSQTVSFEKTFTQMVAMTYAQSIALNSYANKKNVFFISEGLVPPNTQSGIPVVRGWFKVPKGKQRIGLGDKLVFNISGITDGVNVCGMAIYKSYN